MENISKVNIYVSILNNSIVTPKHIMIKLLKSKEKENLKNSKKLYLACREKNHGHKKKVVQHFSNSKRKELSALNFISSRNVLHK